MATVEQSGNSSDAATSPATVLFVDDEPEILEMYELICSEYTVRTADTAEAALEQFGDHINVVFLDRRMPDASGGELFETMRDSGHETTVGMISALEPDDSLDVDPDVYLTKPVSRDELLDAVESHTA
jgi:DNA-binding response OmpR family regulator